MLKIQIRSFSQKCTDWLIITESSWSLTTAGFPLYDPYSCIGQTGRWLKIRRENCSWFFLSSCCPAQHKQVRKTWLPGKGLKVLQRRIWIQFSLNKLYVKRSWQQPCYILGRKSGARIVLSSLMLRFNHPQWFNSINLIYKNDPGLPGCRKGTTWPLAVESLPHCFKRSVAERKIKKCHNSISFLNFTVNETALEITSTVPHHLQLHCSAPPAFPLLMIPLILCHFWLSLCWHWTHFCDLDWLTTYSFSKRISKNTSFFPCQCTGRPNKQQWGIVTSF